MSPKPGVAWGFWYGVRFHRFLFTRAIKVAVIRARPGFKECNPGPIFKITEQPIKKKGKK